MTSLDSHLARLQSRVESAARAINRQPVWLVVLVLVAASLIRSGVVLWNWFFLSPNLVEDWGSPANPFQSNVLFNAFGSLWATAIGPPQGFAWLLVQCLLSAGTLFLIGWLVFKRTRAALGPLGVALVLASGVSTVIWREIGRYDFIFLGAIFVAVLARGRWFGTVALAVAAFSAPEQALLASLTWLLLAALPGYRKWLKSGLTFLVMAIAATLLVQIWFNLLGQGLATRLGLLTQLVRGDLVTAPSRFDPGQGFLNVTIQKLYEGLAPGPALIWSYLGAMSFVLLLLIMAQPRLASAIWLVMAAVAFPLGTTLFFGEDPTRDLVIVGVPALVILLLEATPLIQRIVARLSGAPIVWLTWMAIAVTLLPTVYYFFTSEVAYNFVTHMLISWNNGTPIDWSGNTR